MLRRFATVIRSILCSLSLCACCMHALFCLFYNCIELIFCFDDLTLLAKFTRLVCSILFLMRFDESDASNSVGSFSLTTFSSFISSNRQPLICSSLYCSSRFFLSSILRRAFDMIPRNSHAIAVFALHPTRSVDFASRTYCIENLLFTLCVFVWNLAVILLCLSLRFVKYLFRLLVFRSISHFR